MIPAVFVSSVVLLVAVLMMARVELYRGVRMGGNTRRSIERSTLSLFRRTRVRAIGVYDFVQQDVCMKFLHGVSYVALQSVRYAERRLASLTEWFQALRHRRKK